MANVSPSLSSSSSSSLALSFDDLSDECLLLIFSSLSSIPDQSAACRVSSRWYRLMSESVMSLHLRPSLPALSSSHQVPQTIAQWQRLFTRFSKTATLRFSGDVSVLSLSPPHSNSHSLSHSLSTPSFPLLSVAVMALQSFKNLHTLGLANILGFKDKEIVTIFEVLEKERICLKRLELFFWQGVTDVTAQSIASKCRSLTHLHISGTHFTNQGLQAITDNCFHIEHLVLDGLRSATSGGIVSMTRSYAVRNGLVSVRVCGVEQTNSLLLALANNPNSHRLKELYLEGSGQPLETRVLSGFVESCPFLEHLNLRELRMSQILDPSSFRVDFSNLRTLYMPRDCCSGQNLKLFTAHAPKLIALYLVAQDFPYTYNVGLTDEGIRSLSLTCPLLEVLYIRANHKEFRGSGFRAGFPHLAHLSMWGNFGVNNDGLAAIAEGCPCLMSLGVSQSMPISVEGLKSAISSCMNLENVTVAGSLSSRSLWLGATNGTNVKLSTVPPSELSRDFVVNGNGDLDPCWKILR